MNQDDRVEVLELCEATMIEVAARRDVPQFVCGLAVALMVSALLLVEGPHLGLAFATASLWYVVLGLGFNRNRIEIDTGGISSRVRPLPSIGRRIGTLGDGREAFAHSYTIHGRNYHGIFLGYGKPLAFAGSERAARTAAEIIRAHARRWSEPPPLRTHRF